MPMVIQTVMVICEVDGCAACAAGSIDEIESMGWRFLPAITVDFRCGLAEETGWTKRNQSVYCKEHHAEFSEAKRIGG